MRSFANKSASRRAFLKDATLVGISGIAGLGTLGTEAVEGDEFPSERTENQYKQDLEFAFETVFSVHPRPDFKVRMDELEAARKLALLRVQTCASVGEFVNIAQEFFHLLGDGHTYIRAHSPQTGKFSPLATKWVGGHIIVDKVYDHDHPGDEKPESGDVILAIDGEEAVKKLQARISRAAYCSLEYARRDLASRILDEVETEREFAEVTIARSDGSIRAHSIPLRPLSDKSVMERFIQERKTQLSNSISVSYIDAMGAAVLKYSACVDRSMYEKSPSRLGQLGLTIEDLPDFEEECWRMFQVMRERGYSVLVIDLRGNQGGNSSISEVLFKYITQKPLKTYGGELKVSPELKQMKPYYKDAKIGLVSAADSNTIEYPYTTRLDESRLSNIQQFDGQLFVCIDPLVFSSGEWLAAQIAANGLGVLVGEPTGGGGSVPGDQLPFKLPNTQLDLLVSHKFFECPVDTSYPGVVPDWWVPSSLGDLREGRDPAIAFIRDRV